jgi:hypothetical protein
MNYHPKASLDTNPGEGAAKQSGKAPSALCEVGIGRYKLPTNATADRTSFRSTNFKDSVATAVEPPIGNFRSGSCNRHSSITSVEPRRCIPSRFVKQVASLTVPRGKSEGR